MNWQAVAIAVAAWVAVSFALGAAWVLLALRRNRRLERQQRDEQRRGFYREYLAALRDMYSQRSRRD